MQMEYIWWCASLVGYHWCASLVGYHLYVYIYICIHIYIYIIIIICLYNTSTNAEMYERGGPPHNQEGCDIYHLNKLQWFRYWMIIEILGSTRKNQLTSFGYNGYWMTLGYLWVLDILLVSGCDQPLQVDV